MLGAGRATKDDVIDHAVGLVMHRRFGDAVKRDEALCTLYVNDEKRLEEATDCLRSAIEISGARPEPQPMVYGVVR